MCLSDWTTLGTSLLVKMIPAPLSMNKLLANSRFALSPKKVPRLEVRLGALTILYRVPWDENELGTVRVPNGPSSF